MHLQRVSDPTLHHIKDRKCSIINATLCLYSNSLQNIAAMQCYNTLIKCWNFRGNTCLYWYIRNQLSSRNLMMGRRWHFAVKEAEERRGGQKRMLTGNDTKQNSSNGMSTLANVCTGRRVLANGYVAASVSIWWGPAWESGSRSKFRSELFHFHPLDLFPSHFHSISIPYLPFLSPSSAYRSWLRNAPIYQVRHFWQ